VTFLFTDVEGSTRWWEHDEAAMNAVLKTHDETIGKAVAAHHGRIFSHAGDGFAAAFLSAAEAIAAAADAQRGLDALDGHLPIAVRMGLHTGEAFERDGDYFGPALSRAARLMACAHGGQIVCSRATAELARSGLPAEFEFAELGTYRLKDLLAPEVIVQVHVPGLLAAFPPLRTLDAVRHNLPVQPTRLIGRDDEVKSLIRDFDGCRLVTLTGVGGSGKTRLALAAAAELAAHHEDGVVFVPLTEVTASSGIVDAVTRSMGARLVSSQPEELAAFLAHRDVVLLLDNCEHLLDDVVDLVELVLASGTAPTILTTSREPLGVAAERVVRVASLPIRVADGEPGAAVALLIERAAAIGAPVDAVDRSLLEQLCERLDGIPLAIELAAAQLDLLSPADLLARLDRRFDLLVGGHGRRRQRQQTLQAVMDWSWELLDQDERSVLPVLAVFTGAWPLAAAEAIASPFTSKPVTAVLHRLVAKSLVEKVFTATGTRYRLLETVRLFAAGKLVEQGLAEAARAAHARYHVDAAFAIGAIRGFFDDDVADRVLEDLSDLESAIDDRVRHGDHTGAASLALLASGVWTAGFGSSRGVAWIEEIEAGIDDELLRARVLAAGGFAAVGAGRHDLTRRWEVQALELSAGRDAFAWVLAACLRAAPLSILDPPQARGYLLQALETAVRSGSRELVQFAQLWVNIAVLCSPDIDLPHVDERQLLDQGVSGYAGAARQIGALRLAEAGRYDEARALLFRGERLVDNGPMEALSAVLVEALAGDPAVALDLARELVHAVDRYSPIVSHGELVLVTGIALGRAGHLELALEHIEAAKRAPMAFPYWYALARRVGRPIRLELGEAAVETVLARARPSWVEDLLDQELRRPAATPSSG